MTMIEISESKFDKMGEYVEKMLHYGGRLMSCLEELEGGEMGYREGQSGGSYGNRSMMGSRGNYGNRGYGSRGGYGQRGGEMGYREDEEWMEDEDMNERRRRSRRTGRYM